MDGRKGDYLSGIKSLFCISCTDSLYHEVQALIFQTNSTQKACCGAAQKQSIHKRRTYYG